MKIKKYLLFLLILLPIIFFFSCSFETPTPTGNALIYGVSTYKGVPQLNYTDNDAILFNDYLVKAGWNTELRVANTGEEAQDLCASKEQIISDIKALEGTKGTILFFFTGHGTDGGYIVPYKDYSSGVAVEDFISRNELFSLFNEMNFDNVIIILDACYSGDFVLEGSTIDSIPSDYVGQTDFVEFSDLVKTYVNYESVDDFIIISASGGDEESMEASFLGHGVFTYCLCEGLKDGNADIDKDGIISTTEAYSFTTNAMKAFYKKYFANLNNYYWHLSHLSGNTKELGLIKY